MRSERSSRSAQVLGWGVILVMGLGWLAAARAEELPGLRQAVTNVFLTTPAEPPRSPTVEELRVVFETVVRERPLRYYICGRVYYTGRPPTKEEWERDVKLQLQAKEMMGYTVDRETEARIRDWVWHTFRQRRMEWWKEYRDDKEYRLETRVETNAGPALCDFVPEKVVIQTNLPDGAVRSFTVNHDVRSATLRVWPGERSALEQVFRIPTELYTAASTWLGDAELLLRSGELRFDPSKAASVAGDRAPVGRMEAVAVELFGTRALRLDFRLASSPLAIVERLKPRLALVISPEPPGRLLATYVGTSGQWEARVYRYGAWSWPARVMGRVKAEEGKDLEVETYYVDEFRELDVVDRSLFEFVAPREYLVVERDNKGEVAAVLQAPRFMDVSPLTNRAAWSQPRPPAERRTLSKVAVGAFLGLSVGLLVWVLRQGLRRQC
ncbi:MAG: hypothetical protein N2438_02320 [Limisphaera sp.]|jgi:hypothetical protein|nr:hypothetical protein [Limisphaera sp.]